MLGVGDPVRLRKRVASDKSAVRQSSVIVGYVEGVAGGVILAEALDGFRAWNLADLERAPYGQKIGSRRRRRTCH